TITPDQLPCPTRRSSDLFDHPPADLQNRLRALPEITSVQSEAAGMYRLLTANGSRTTTTLVEMSVEARVPVRTLTVQNTTLDDRSEEHMSELQSPYYIVC